MAKFYRRWMKIGAGAGAGIVSIVGLFMLLASHFGFEITGENDICAGTLDDPCMSRVWIENPTRYNVDIYNPDAITLDFAPEVPDYKLFAKDGRCSGKDGSACCSPDGICLKGWRYTDFTNETKPRSDTSYVYRFPAYTTKEFLVWGLKHSPTDRVKWGLEFDGPLLSNGYLDPVWEYGNDGTGDLVAHLKMNGDATDSSQYGNDGTIYGAVASVPGRHSLGYDFDGSTGYINISDDTSLDVHKNFSLSAWIKTTGSESTIISKWKGGSNGRSWWFRINAGVLTLTLSDSGNNAESETGSATINDGDWHHVVLNYESDSKNVTFYIDGAFDEELTYSTLNGTIFNSVTEVLVGSDIVMSNMMDGILDDVRVYNVSLSEPEVRELYNETKVSHSSRLYGSSETAQPASANLVGHYKMNGNILDSSASGNDGTLSGSPAIIPGRFGLTYNFDAVDDRIDLPDVPEFNFSTNVTPFSISAWAKSNDKTRYNFIVSESAGGAGWSLRINTVNGQPTFIAFTGTDIAATCVGTDLSDGEWHHSVAVYNLSHFLLYCDGKSAVVSASPIIEELNLATNAVTIGSLRANLNNGNWNGTLDEVRIYNASLTESQVQQLYNETKTSHSTRLYGAQEEAQPVTNNLVGHYKMNGNILDSSASGNDGTLSGSPAIIPGRFGLAYQFDGNDDYINLPNSVSLDFSTENVTITAWVKEYGTGTKYIYVSGVGAGSNKWIAINTVNNVLNVLVDNGTSLVQGSNSDFPVNEWTHISSTFYLWDNITTYINGEYNFSVDISSLSGDIDNSEVGKIGMRVIQSWDGIIDEFRIYNTSISATQVEQLYNETKTSHSKRIYGSPEMT